MKLINQKGYILVIDLFFSLILISFMFYLAMQGYF